MTDPVFGDIYFHKRISEIPYKIEELGEISFILISHSHYDHLDIKSIRAIQNHSPRVTIISTLGMSKYFKNLNLRVIELDWFESFEIDEVKIVMLPAKHWGRRTAFDLNKSLWGSFLIDKIYFAGDTSYSEHFKIIGNKYQIDIALMPIGAYKPEHIMKHNHMNPIEAIKGSIDLKAINVIPMHYGTFKLSDELLSEPLQLFIKRQKV